MDDNIHVSFSERKFWISLHATFFACVLFWISAVLFLNEGHFTYALDDAYIHLAMSEQIADGGYGVNAGHFASASSSIIFPFLLSWASPFSFHLYLPLIYNCLALFGSIEVLRRFFIEFCFRDSPRQRYLSLALTGVFVVSTNIFGVVFTGMEHSLQILDSLLVAYGLIRFLDRGEIRWWFAAAIVLGPLVRYENLAISLPAIGILACRRRGKEASMIGLVCIGLVVMFSLYLEHLGLRFLPNPIIAKSAMVANMTNGATNETIAALGRNFLERTTGTSNGITLLLLFILTITRLSASAVYPLSDSERWFGVFVAAAAGAHLLAGDYLFGRYEAYVFAVTALGLTYIFRMRILGFIRAHRGWGVACVAVVLLGYVGHDFVKWTVLSPVGANNIYEQHHQMRRFATRYLAAPVAVNDIGYVSYRNDRFVLDLWGLASDESLRARMNGYQEKTLQHLTEKNGIKVAMIYDRWFPHQIPGAWARIAELSLRRLRVSSSERTVVFYATDPASAADVRKALGAFADTLPTGVTLRLL